MFDIDNARELTSRTLLSYSQNSANLPNDVDALIHCLASADFNNYIAAFGSAPTQVPEDKRVYKPEHAGNLSRLVVSSVMALAIARRIKSYQTADVHLALSSIDTFLKQAPRLSAEVDESFLK